MLPTRRSTARCQPRCRKTGRAARMSSWGGRLGSGGAEGRSGRTGLVSTRGRILLGALAAFGTVGRRAAAAAVAGAVLFLAGAAAPRVGAFNRDTPADVALYQEFGDKVLDGGIPYRTFSLEYPPGALPAFVLPSLGPRDDYTVLFKLLMALSGLVAVCAVAIVLAAVEAGPIRLFGGVALVALAPAVLGPTAFNRYDLFPAALTVAALAFLLAARRERLGLAVLGYGAAAKVFPAAAALAALAWIRANAGGRRFRAALVAFVATAFVVVLPFALLGPGGVRFTVMQQLRRPLQIESVGGTILSALDRLGVGAVEVVQTYGSYNVAGSVATAVALASSLVLVLALVTVWRVVARRPSSPELLLTASATAVASFAVTGKVFSPQYLVWLMPLVPLVRGRLGLAAGALFVCALGLTRLYFPGRYGSVVTVGDATWIVAARNGVLLALLVVLFGALLREGAYTTNPSTRTGR